MRAWLRGIKCFGGNRSKPDLCQHQVHLQSAFDHKLILHTQTPSERWKSSSRKLGKTRDSERVRAENSVRCSLTSSNHDDRQHLHLSRKISYPPSLRWVNAKSPHSAWRPRCSVPCVKDLVIFPALLHLPCLVRGEVARIRTRRGLAGTTTLALANKMVLSSSPHGVCGLLLQTLSEDTTWVVFRGDILPFQLPLRDPSSLSPSKHPHHFTCSIE